MQLDLLPPPAIAVTAPADLPQRQPAAFDLRRWARRLMRGHATNWRITHALVLACPGDRNHECRAARSLRWAIHWRRIASRARSAPKLK